VCQYVPYAIMLVLAASERLSPVSSFQTFCRPSSAFLHRQISLRYINSYLQTNNYLNHCSQQRVSISLLQICLLPHCCIQLPQVKLRTDRSNGRKPLKYCCQCHPNNSLNSPQTFRPQYLCHSILINYVATKTQIN